MAEAIVVALSKIKTCLANEACNSAISKLSGEATSLKELKPMMEQVKKQLDVTHEFILQQTGTDHLINTVDNHWVAMAQTLAFLVEDVMHKYLYHALKLHLGQGNAKDHAAALCRVADGTTKIERHVKRLVSLRELSVPPSQLVVPTQPTVVRSREGSNLPRSAMDIHKCVELLRRIAEWMACLVRLRETAVPPPVPPGDAVTTQDRMFYLVNFLVVLNQDNRMFYALTVLSGVKSRKVMSIVGSGGIGKTALASELYQKTRGSFSRCAFVTLSRRPDMRRALAEILGQISPPKNSADNENLDQDKLIGEIQRVLQYSRYLIVINDIWQPEVWGIIKHAFPSNSYSSKVITTTHLNDVAQECCSGESDFVYKVEPPTDESPMSCDLAKLKETLFLSCSGSCFTLEACSLYLSTVPDNHKFERDSLVRKWVAEGFIPEEEGHSLEAVADRYFGELINRNVIQQAGRCYRFGEEPTYQVHPTILRVLREVSQEKSFATFIPAAQAAASADTSAVFDAQPAPAKIIRRLCVHLSDPPPPPEAYSVDLSSARSVTIFGHVKGVVPLKHLNEQHLHVLNLEGCTDLEDADVVDICRRMILLKYLSLKGTPVTELPPDVKNLQNLETLDVRETGLKELPQEVAELSKLAHLLFGEGVKLNAEEAAAPAGGANSIKVLGCVDSSECSESIVRDLRELAVVCRDGCSDSIDTLPAAPGLEKLKVAGRCVKVPRWIKGEQLSGLTLLDIRVLELRKSDLETLGKMSSLRILVLALVGLRRDEIVITKDAGFQNLEVFALDCRVAWVTFEREAMSRLKHLHLKIYAGPAGMTPSGTMHLEKLREVTLQYSPHYAGSAYVNKTTAVMEEEARKRTRPITLFINEEGRIPKIEVPDHTRRAPFSLACRFLRLHFRRIVVPVIAALHLCDDMVDISIWVPFLFSILLILLLYFIIHLSFYALLKITIRLALAIVRVVVYYLFGLFGWR